MQARKRYLLVFLSIAFLVLCYFGGYRLKERTNSWEHPFDNKNLKHFVNIEEFDDVGFSPSLLRSFRHSDGRSCRFETCFNLSKCSLGFKVYVYPIDENVPPSSSYQKILNVITGSRYYTRDPTEACLYLLALDTLDRDVLSHSYVHNIPARIKKLTHWNRGENHLIFNLYSGTWPSYLETLGFDTEKAMVAKASFSWERYRPGFDISIPLFHKDHLERGTDGGYSIANNFPANKKYLLAFKGKRYTHGIGSETRNSLFHLHNGKDTVLVTTCKHGKSWKETKDERCDEDNLDYDRYDYQVLLQNSTFCLVPRGRRLGSFRFLEALQAGCIPVLLSNGWRLPFAEVIDWSTATVPADERLLLQVPDMVRSISTSGIMKMRQHTQFLYSTYFSSVENIVLTTLMLIEERISSHVSRSADQWNTFPGGISVMPQYLHEYPFKNEENATHFTAAIYVQSGLTPALRKLIKNVAKSQYIARVVVLWSLDSVPPLLSKWPSVTAPLNVLPLASRAVSARFRPHSLFETNAILSLDEDVSLTTDEVDFAFLVWRSFPDRIVGYPARSHYWDESKNRWGYTSKLLNEYSMVLAGCAFYHRYYHWLFTNTLSPLLLRTVDQSANCEDILLNFLVSHITRRPPIKLTQRKHYKDESQRSRWSDAEHFLQRQSCMNTFASVFGYMPLLRSSVRLDPVLFKDPVSNLRKKFRQIELAPS